MLRIALLIALLGADGRQEPRLRFFQSQQAPLLRSHYTLLIRPQDRPGALAALLLEWPAGFDGRPLLESLRLCRMVAPPQTLRSRCVAVRPARVERVGPRGWRILPEQPLAGEALHGLSLQWFNPSRPGLYPLQLRATLTAAPSDGPLPLGSWWIPIISDDD
ncbi:MAG: hypothetical protein VKK97_08805 [Synechococcaceae cyanobacterium]|nr:hypothetical protein [Synechococcaceae cyanobacterium]